MKPLLLLLLLTSWTHLVSDAGICNTGVALENQLVNIEGSRTAGADAYFIKAYKTENLKTCLEECCSAKFGACSVAAYKNSSSNATCLHFYCEPLSNCKFLPSDFADSYAYPHATTSTHRIHVKELLVTPISTIVSLLKDHERHVTARKGAVNVPLTRKGVAKDDIYLDGELSYMDDNFTNVSNTVGVDFFHHVVTTPLSNISVIKPRKGVETRDGFGSENFSKSKIKARKGVEHFLPASTMPLVSSLPSILTPKVVSPSESFFHDKQDLLILLQDVFTDDLNITELATEVPEPTSIPSSKPPELSTTVILSVFTSPNHSSTFIPTPSSSPSISTVVPQTTGIFEDNSDADNDTSFYDDSGTTSELSSSISYDQSNTHFSSIQSTTALEMSTSQNVFYTPTHSKLIISQTPIIIQSKINPSSEMVAGMLLNNEQHDSQQDIEDKYESSMHLVFALVFGLLVLFGVIGTIAKRVYDGWVRRHYRRMDFLIDGMYDGYST